MKVLIIAGPYEADRIRRAVVSAGFEAVAVEPGESLSGWITASRPDVIVLAPQIVNADPAVALGKVRAAPRGRVPTFLVGEPEDEGRMKGLADGFLTRPLSMPELVARVRARLQAGPGERRPGSGEIGIPAAVSDGGSGEFARPGGSKAAGAPGAGGTPAGGPTGARTPTSTPAGRALPTLKPLVAASSVDVAPVPRVRQSEAGALFVKLAESIDATLDAEMFDVARSVGALRREITSPGSRSGVQRPPADLFERTPMAPMTALAAAARVETTALTSPAAFDVGEELGDETRQKTVEVPRDVFAKMIAERIAAARDGGGEAGAPAPVESGKIADSDVAAQLGRLYLQRLSGRLTLRREAIEKIIFFDRGAPILGMSSDPDDRMGEMLVRQGRLTAAQLAQASEGLPRAERRLGAVLVERGFIKPTELSVVVRRHFEEIIYSAFAWEDGEWSLAPGQPNQEIVLLDEHPAAIILAGIRRKYAAARLQRCLGGGAQVFKPSSGRADDLLPRMGMTTEERALVDLFDGERTLDEVRALSGAREEVVGGVAWALSVLGQLELVSPDVVPAFGLPAFGPEAPAAAPRNGAGFHEVERSVVVAERSRVGAGRAEVRARILARHALVEEGDYFEILELPRGAGPDEIRRAHANLARAFAPTSLDAVLVAELGAELRAIRAVLDEALRVLGEPRMRARYESHLPAAAAAAAAD
ncbi:MAG TPA: DUF4388 domain-containing protein [Polyangia bacterium]|nr:DUF4388 domain-containing protein [Polyangia bacterium]